MALVMCGTLLIVRTVPLRRDEDIHLNGFAEILSDTLSLNDVLVDLAGCDIVVSSECGQKISLIVAEIKIHFLY